MLRYRHPGVVRRLRHELGYGGREGLAIFLDLLRFLWLSVQHHRLREAESPAVAELPELKMAACWQPLDDAWHVFLLYSRDYERFCRFHFGVLIAHVPETAPRRGASRQAQVERLPAEWAKRFRAFAAPQIGARATTRLIEGYPRRFSRQALFRRRLRALRARYGNGS
jgi:hypothetical protein